MANYCNTVGIHIAEIAKLQFMDVTTINQNGEEVQNNNCVAEVAMHIEVLRNLNNVIKQSLKNYDDNQAKAVEAAKGMN